MTRRIGPDSDGGTVTVAADDVVEIALPQTAGTGYLWEPADLPDGVTLVADRVSAAPVRAAGAATERVFALRVAGSGPVVLRLRRPWEPPDAAERTFTVQVRAQAADG